MLRDGAVCWHRWRNCCAWWWTFPSVAGATGVVHHEYAPPGQTIIKEYYIKVPHQLRDAVRRKWPQLWASGDWWLSHDNAPTCPFFSSCAVFFGKTSHHPGLSVPLQPRFGSLWLLAFPKAKIAVESEEICECDGHTVHKLSEWHLTADWLVPRESVPGCAVRSSLTGCQVTSRPCDQFSRYSKWLDTFWTDFTQ